MEIKQPIVIDVETYYRNGGCSVRANRKSGWVGGNYNYVKHPDFYCYLLSYYDLETHEKGIRKGAEIPKFIEDRLNGRTFVAHNAGFDYTVCRHLVPSFMPLNTVDTADLAAYLQVPRNLAGASKYLLGHKVSKAVRDNMSGRHYRDLSVQETAAMDTYALLDAELEADIFLQYFKYWPDNEVFLSDHTRRCNVEGVRIDTDFLDDQLERVHSTRSQALYGIPWADTPEDKPLSAHRLGAWCRDNHIDPPESTAEKDPRFHDWMRVNSERAPVIACLRDYRKSNMYVQKLTLMQELLRPDGTMEIEAMYCAAPHTMRWSAKRFNFQSLPRLTNYCDLRGCLVPPEGQKFMTSDLSNIEARVLPWLAKEWDILKQIGEGLDIYEQFARASLGYSDAGVLKKVNPDLRNVAKACVLQLGFQSGGKKFLWYLENNNMDEAMDIVRLPEEDNADLANRLVYDVFRGSRPKLTSLWHELNIEFTEHTNRFAKQYEVCLPNGRVTHYFRPHLKVYTDEETQLPKREMVASVYCGDTPRAFYGGKLVQNATQATARCVIGEALERVEKAGIKVGFHVHDELICNVDKADVEDARVILGREMSRTPHWLRGCPVATDTDVLDRYKKG